MKKIFTILAALLVCTTSFAIYLDAPTYTVVGQDLNIKGTSDDADGNFTSRNKTIQQHCMRCNNQKMQAR